MSTKKKLLIACVAVVLVAVGAFLFMYKDMTGMPYSEIEAYMEAHPNKIVHYSVTINGNSASLEITNKDDSVFLTDCSQTAGMAAQADYLQHLQTISFGEMTPTAAEVAQLTDAFPNTEIQYGQVAFLGKTYPADTAEIDLSQLQPSEIEEAALGLSVLPQLKTVALNPKDTVSAVSLDDAAALQAASPDVFFQYTVNLFGQQISTDMESVEYFRVYIGNEGLDYFRKLIPLMPNLTYLKLDTCEIDNEVMAAFREEFKDQCKVVWRVFFGQNNALTDTYKIWATWNIDTKEVDVLKYCNEVKYLDLGHNSFMNLDFLKGMPDLEMAILAIGNLQDISGIVGCTKLEFLEIFSNRDLTNEDMQHLSALTNMKYLNISNTILMTDMSFTDHMPKLKRLWNTLNRCSAEEVERVKALHPDCEFFFIWDGDPTDYGWRYTKESNYNEMTPEYALVRARFGYADWDFSRDEKGYLREEITYESLGLTPS